MGKNMEHIGKSRGKGRTFHDNCKFLAGEVLEKKRGEHEIFHGIMYDESCGIITHREYPRMVEWEY